MYVVISYSYRSTFPSCFISLLPSGCPRGGWGARVGGIAPPLKNQNNHIFIYLFIYTTFIYSHYSHILVHQNAPNCFIFSKFSRVAYARPLVLAIAYISEINYNYFFINIASLVSKLFQNRHQNASFATFFKNFFMRNTP